MKIKFLIISVLASFLLGQTLDPAYMASFGSVTINGQLYNQVSFRPEFSTDKIGIGWDIYLYFDEDGNLYTENWDFSSTSASLKTIVDKIYYLRYGQPIDDLYFRIGALPDVTLGQGILIKNYANNIDYPQIRRAGFDFRYQLSGFKLQVIHSDLKEINKPGLIGFRGAIPILDNFDIGFSLASDFNQFNGLVDSDGDGYPDFIEPEWADNSEYWHINQFAQEAIENNTECEYDDDNETFGNVTCQNLWDDLNDVIDEDYNEFMGNKDNVSGLSIDLGYKLNDQILIYSEYAQLLGETKDPREQDSIIEFDETLGYGFIPIGVRGTFGAVDFSMDYRRSSNNFIFGYWDKNYDHNRIMENNGVLITKESTLYQYGSQKGFNLGLEANVSKYFKFSLDYTRMKGNMWGAGSCDNDTFITSAECTADNQEDNPDTPDIDESEGNNTWMWGQYQTDKNNSLYAKFEIDTSSIPRVQIAEVFYQQTNSDKPFNFKPNENTLIGYNIGVDLSNSMILVLKGRKSYEFDGDGYKPVHSTQIETSIYF